jgi:hypothetical protein
VRFVVDEVAVEQVFLRVFFGFSLLITSPLLLHTHQSPPPYMCDYPYQAAHSHMLGLLVCGFNSDPTLGWLQSKELSFFIHVFR